jgi:hypothetical protein
MTLLADEALRAALDHLNDFVLPDKQSLTRQAQEENRDAYFYDNDLTNLHFRMMESYHEHDPHTNLIFRIIRPDIASGTAAVREAGRNLDRVRGEETAFVRMIRNLEIALKLDIVDRPYEQNFTPDKSNISYLLAKLRARQTTLPRA